MNRRRLITPRPVEPSVGGPTLEWGDHSSREEGMCAMEWVAYLAGEEHSDSPRCVSEFLQILLVTLNDELSPRRRQRLWPYLMRCIDTADDGDDANRIWLCVDWLTRECLPDLLTRAQSPRRATRLASSVPVRDGVCQVE